MDTKTRAELVAAYRLQTKKDPRNRKLPRFAGSDAEREYLRRDPHRYEGMRGAMNRWSDEQLHRTNSAHVRDWPANMQRLSDRQAERRARLRNSPEASRPPRLAADLTSREPVTMPRNARERRIFTPHAPPPPTSRNERSVPAPLRGLVSEGRPEWLQPAPSRGEVSEGSAAWLEARRSRGRPDPMPEQRRTRNWSLHRTSVARDGQGVRRLTAQEEALYTRHIDSRGRVRRRALARPEGDAAVDYGAAHDRFSGESVGRAAELRAFDEAPRVRRRRRRQTVAPSSSGWPP